ncbi:uncharacterized protein LOC132728642 [Ruditapes philippinarum]|uniref:uncharacterized protein LOC132728642 n=1 Tax=Ruditapes philippinarum TaxID=129788 RepID=UPI00295AFB25|nr:uncharacterized protein LOC132728642 [Ruditapes philippinarum]
MSKYKITSLSSVQNELKEYCQHHEVEIIQHYCRDHKVLACSSCVASDHRACKNDYIPEVSRNYNNSKEFKAVLQSLQIIQTNCQKMMIKSKENQTKIAQNESKVRQEIKKLCREIRDRIDQWEKELENEAAELLKIEHSKTDSIGNECKKIESQITILQDDLKALQASNRNNELFVRVKKSEIDLQNYSTAMSEMAENTLINDVMLITHAPIQKILKVDTCLGEVVSKESSNTQIETIEPIKLVTEEPKKVGALYDRLSATFSGQINIKMLSDKTTYNITGIAIIGTDLLAVADFINSKIKTVDAKQHKVLSSLKLSSGPWDLARLPEDELAVTLPDEHIIQIVSTSGVPSTVKQIKVGGYCYGLAYSDEKLVVTLHTFPANVQTITMDGTVLQTIKFDTFGKGLFVFPWYVTINEMTKQIYISDSDKKDIKCVDWNGEVEGVYTEPKLSCTYGLASLVDGTIIVSSYNNNTLHLVSSDFKKGRVLLQYKDGIRDPRCLAVNWDQRKLYIGCYQNVNIQVYDLK